MMWNELPSIVLLIAFLIAIFSFFLISQVFLLKKEVRKLKNIVNHLLKKDKEE